MSTYCEQMSSWKMKPSQGMKLVALDLDGTLLNSKHQLSTTTIDTLSKLSNTGVIVCLATGRSVGNVRSILLDLQLHQALVPLVVNNGGYGFLCSVNEKEIILNQIFANPIPELSMKNLIDFALEKDLLIQYYDGATGEVMVVPKNDIDYEYMKRYVGLVGNPQTIIPSYEIAIAKCPSAKALIFTSDADQLVTDAYERFGKNEFNIFRGSPDPFFVEFLRADVSKGSGLQLLCNRLNIEMSEVMAFGDGENDIEMLQLAGVGVAMKNAKDGAKAAADVVLENTNDEDGVAKYLVEYFKL